MSECPRCAYSPYTGGVCPSCFYIQEEEKTKMYGYCKICGSQGDKDYCCALCDELAYTNIRALADLRVVLIDGIPCGAIHSLMDKANNVELYYGILDEFPSYKTQVFTSISEVLSALNAFLETLVQEIPPEEPVI